MTVGVHEFWSFFLILTRVTALFMSAPVFAMRNTPGRVKIGLGALIAFALMPQVESRVGPAPTNLLTLVGQLMTEIVLGVCLGMIAQLLISALEMAGHYVDTQMGFGIINVLNPMSEHQTSTMGQFLQQLGTVIFLILGGHLFLIRTLAGSFLSIAPGGAHFGGDVMAMPAQVATEMLIVSFKIAAPAAAVLLAVDVAFGIISRTMPQMNILVVGLPLKIVVGMGTMALLLPAVAVVVSALIPSMGGSFSSFLSAAR
jgi:flagellar biosynthetic protein FliR